ncbi:MAG TPA: ABC transporter permease [Lacunisphaera sp.]|jgi:ABC-2 type transport system permease protein
MKRGSTFSGLIQHFRLVLQLNFRSTQALIYGYLMPVFFLLAFGSVFRGDTPPLLPEMGQILTITILGGACLGLPTALVAERERGVWRRYRLLPVPTLTLVLSTLLARLLIIGSAIVLQIFLARLVFHTPLPSHSAQLALTFLPVAFAFMGLGLLVAALANDVPAVQALGQCLFLPMILIGGVGVPLAALPAWAQEFSGFMPGRYAVDVLQRCFTDPSAGRGAGFSLVALGIIGLAAGVVGAKLFRWDVGRRGGRLAGAGLAIALLSWIAVGAAAAWTGRLQPLPTSSGYETITAAQMDQITYDDLPGDNELVTRLAPPFARSSEPHQSDEIAYKLKAWPPAHVADAGQAARNLLSVAAIADIAADLHEAEIGRAVFDELQERIGRDQLRRILAWVILSPDAGTVITTAPELGLKRHPPERIVRERSVLYAKKYLGRLLGKIRDN